MVPYYAEKKIVVKPKKKKITKPKQKRAKTYKTKSGKVVKNRPNRNKRYTWILKLMKNEDKCEAENV